MMRTFLEVSRAPGDLLGQVSDHMKWGVTISAQDINELQKFVSLMDPIERVFSGLNSEKEATLHLVIPFLKVSSRLPSFICFPVI